MLTPIIYIIPPQKKKKKEEEARFQLILWDQYYKDTKTRQNITEKQTTDQCPLWINIPLSSTKTYKLIQNIWKVNTMAMWNLSQEHKVVSTCENQCNIPYEENKEKNDHDNR